MGLLDTSLACSECVNVSELNDQHPKAWSHYDANGNTMETYEACEGE